MMILDNSISILMMKEDNNGNNLAKLNEKAKKILTNTFGGMTVEKAAGTWLDNGILYQDQSYKFTCNFKGVLNAAQTQAIKQVLELEFKEGGQLAVSILRNSKLMIVEEKDLVTSEFEKAIA